MRKQATRRKNSALLAPEDSCLLFIDFGGVSPGIQSAKPTIGPLHYEVLTKARELSIPAFLSCMEDPSDKRHEYPLDPCVPANARLRRPMINPCDDDCLRATITEQKRCCLILAGGWPEGSLAQAALGALGEAYDVYVLFDLSAGLQDLDNSPIATRLVQAGVVPLTARQLILEWTKLSSAL